MILIFPRKTLFRSSLFNQPQLAPLVVVGFHYSFSLFSSHFSTATCLKTQNALANHLINRHGFSPPTTSKVSSQISHLKSFEKSDLTVDWLRESGFSNARLEILAAKKPQVIVPNLHRTIKLKVQIFFDYGFFPNDVAEILTAEPWFFIHWTARRLEKSILVLKNILGSIEDVTRLLKNCKWFLNSNLDKTMLPNIKYLEKSWGVCPSQIRRYLFTFPRLFLFQPETMKDIAQRVNAMGFADKKSSGMFLQAVRVMSSMSHEKWESKLELFQSLGFTKENISSTFKGMPQIFSVSKRMIRKVVDVLMSAGNVDSSFIIRDPDLLYFSAENRIKPRLLVLDALQTKNLIVRRPSLPYMCRLSNRIFSNRYVLPYEDVLGKACYTLHSKVYR